MKKEPGHYTEVNLAPQAKEPLRAVGGIKMRKIMARSVPSSQRNDRTTAAIILEARQPSSKVRTRYDASPPHIGGSPNISSGVMLTSNIGLDRGHDVQYQPEPTTAEDERLSDSAASITSD